MSRENDNLEQMMKTMALDPGEPRPTARTDNPAPAYLVALNPSLLHREYPIHAHTTVVGREADACDVVCSGNTISRRHFAVTTADRAEFYLEDLNSTNGVFVNRERVKGRVRLQEGDLIGIGSDQITHLRFQSESAQNRPWSMPLPPKKEWTVGRSPDCDVVLAFESTVSSNHATVRLKGAKVEVADRGSLNGTWLNGHRIKRSEVEPTDSLMIGSTILRFQPSGDGGLVVTRRDCGQEIGLECVALTREIRGGKRILDRVTLAVKPGEFVGLLGPSGAGKSTLLKALNGHTPANYGCVLVNETPLYPCFDMFRNVIGYVPQDDIVHAELTVEASLDYVARLRLPSDVTAGQRKDLIDSTIETLGLSHVRHSRVHELSGGQRKRVSIGCELITRPSLLFLDEPTSGMDPSTEERLMRHFQGLADKGTTVLITTHILYNLDLLDRVVIMSRGHLVFFGTPREAMQFFTINGAPVERATQIFEILEGEHLTDAERQRGGDPKVAVAEAYARKYADSEFYARHVAGGLAGISRDLLVATGGHAEATASASRTSAPSLDPKSLKTLVEHPTAGGKKPFSLDWFSPRSFTTLTRRNLAIKLVSPRRALFYLAVPVVLALVSLSLRAGTFPDAAEMDEKRSEIETSMTYQIPDAPMIAPVDLGPPIKDLLNPDAPEDQTGADVIFALRHEGLPNLPVPMSVLLMFVMTAVFMGTLMSCLDLSSERPIYVRERMANQKIADYLGSKLPFLMAITALQCLVFLGICWLKPGLRHFDFPTAFLAMVAMAWTACAMGLFLSAIDPTTGQFSVILAIVMVLPQLVFSGGLAPDFFAGMPEAMKWLAACFPARWGLEMLMTAFYRHPDNPALDWVASFVPDTIGFKFGPRVYWNNSMALLAQAIVWLSACGMALKRLDHAR